MDSATKKFIWLIASLFALIPTGLILYFSGHQDLASFVGTGGTFIVLLGWTLYVVLIDSKKRWPTKDAFTRFSYIITFKR